ncbi:Hypothetical_protein [Hexamita inflata]|uniref:Hypothetical_protein n=1 Tax=Hexamita inflata TaxID=28002 RepID=A0AA86QGS1_9EUKA|nr:Hypothetical protein HINF_LOCUS46714 [Hexamita inflata]
MKSIHRPPVILKKNSTNTKQPKIISISEEPEPELNPYKPKYSHVNQQLPPDSKSCDVFWDQSSKKNVLLTKVSVVNGSRQLKSISIETTGGRDSSNDDLYDMFNDVEFK